MQDARHGQATKQGGKEVEDAEEVQEVEEKGPHR